MQQRRKQPTLTRQAILDASAAEFALNGYAATGIGSIVAKAGLTKGALFHHFPDKRSLALAWISEMLVPALDEIWLMPLKEIHSLSALSAFCRTRCQETTSGDAVSCMVSLSTGTSATEPVIAAALCHAFTSWQTAVADLLERGKSDGWIHPSIKPPAEAMFLVSTFCGFSVIQQCSGDSATLRNFPASLETYIETLRPQ